MAPAFKTFADQNPTIKVDVVYAADHRTKLATQMASGTAPDTFIHDVWSAAKYYDGGEILDLGARFKADKIDLAQQYSLIGIEQWCGKTFAVPFYVTSMLLAYNKDILQKYGAPDPWEKWNGNWTWTDFLDVARTVTRQPSSESPSGTYALRIDGSGIDNIDRNMQMWATSNGGETFNLDSMRYTLDDPKTVDAFDFLNKLVNDYKVMVGPEQQAALSKASNVDSFIAGFVAFQQNSTGTLPQYYQLIKDKFAWDVVPYPHGQGSDFIGHSDADVTNVYAHGKHLDEAYQFAKFLGGPATQEVLSVNKLLIPALKSAAQDPKGFLKPPPAHLSAFLDPLQAGQFRTSFYQYNGLQAISLQDEQLKLAFSRQKGTKEAMLDANTASNAVVQHGPCHQTVTWQPRRA